MRTRLLRQPLFLRLSEAMNRLLLAVVLPLALLRAEAAAAGTTIRIVPAVSDASPDHVVVAIRSGGQQRLIRATPNTPIGVEDAAPVTIEIVEPRKWWSPPLTITEGGVIELPFWPIAEIRGRLGTEKGVDAPRRLAATFEWKHRQFAQRVTVVCPVERDASWRCTLPESKLDVRLGAAD